MISFMQILIKDLHNNCNQGVSLIFSNYFLEKIIFSCWVNICNTGIFSFTKKIKVIVTSEYIYQSHAKTGEIKKKHSY